MNVLLSRMYWAVAVLFAKQFIVATHRRSAMYIPIKPTETIDDVLTLHQQEAALTHFQEKIEELLKEHDEAVRLIELRTQREQSGK